MEVLRDVALCVVGVALIAIVVDAALRTFVLPRASVVRLTRVISVVISRLFELLVRPAKTYEARDRVMALYAPVVLMAMVVVWLAMLIAAFTMIFLAVEGKGVSRAFSEAGSSLFTLGFERPHGDVATVIAFLAAAFGLGLVALLIAYLPTIYSSFSRREVLVAYLTARAGTPPSAIDLLRRAHLIDRLHDLDDLWEKFHLWFAELEETHTSQPLLNFFRSPSPDRSWVTASGSILDAASLINSTVDAGWHPMAGLCVRSGFTALRSIGDFFGMEYPRDPQPGDPITITRDEWMAARDEMAAAGVPLREDVDQAWLDFAGWRVKYDTVLVTLAALMQAPYAPWSSDRSVRFRVTTTAWGRR